MSEQDLKLEIKKAIVDGLKLKREPESIPDQEKLFGGGLYLDSVDVLTLVTELEERFHLEIADDDVEKLNSIEEIAQFIANKPKI